jgi:hypothetical protein
VGRAGRIPNRLACETNLPEGRGRKIPSELNQKTKTKRKSSMKPPKNAMRPVADAVNFRDQPTGAVNRRVVEPGPKAL